MLRVANVLFTLSLSLWIGGLTALAAFAAPAIFRTAGSRQLAGTIFGSVLRTFGWAEIVFAALAAVALATSLALTRPLGALDWARVALLAIMIVLLLAHVLYIDPTIRDVRAQCGNFDLEPATDIERAARDRFDGLHRASVRVAGAIMLLGVALLAVTAWRPRA